MENNWPQEVKKRIQGVPVSSGRSKKWDKISFDDLVFLPGQLAKKPVDYYQEKISSKTIVGKLSKKPLELEIPVIMGAMSFGALSKEAKIALAKASTLAGTMANTGEGGMLPEERKEAKLLIIQYSTGRFGISEEVLKQADAIEIKIGQGAKGGSGGFLPASKITEEISQIRKVPLGKSLHSPAYHKDIENIEDLKKKVDWLREITGGVPIIIKMAGAIVEEDVKLALKANPDIIAIDGLEGGTGASPEVMLDEVGLPTLASLIKARETLDKMNAKQELWIAGGFYKGGDMAKALALGADAIFLGMPLLVAMGCIYCRLCYLGNCPLGIATQKPELREKLDPEASQKIFNYLKNCVEEIKMVSGACGKDDVHKLNKEDLRALSSDISKITKVKFISE